MGRAYWCDVCYNIEILYMRGGKGLLTVAFVIIQRYCMYNMSIVPAYNGYVI